MAEINTNLDTTPLPPNNLVAQDPQSKELAGYVRTKTFGRDVRESIARSIELNSTRSKSAEELANETVNVANDLTERFNAQIGALTEDSEVIDARGDKATLGQRLDDTDKQLAEKSTREEFHDVATLTSSQFNILGDGTDETAKVVEMLNSIPVNGAKLIFDKSKIVRVDGTSLLVLDNRKNVVIEGLNVVGATQALFNIKGGSSHITFRDCYFKDVTQAILLFDCNNITVDNCVFDSTGYGIIQQNGYVSNDVKVINNTAKNMKQDFVEANADNVMSKNWTITGNHYTGSATYPEYGTERRFAGITTVENVIVANNIIEKTAGDSAIHLENIGGQMIIDGNIFDNCIGQYGYIYITHNDKDAIISNNIFKRTDSTIGVGNVLNLDSNIYANPILFTGNRVVGVNQNMRAINASYQKNLSVKNNHFDGCEFAIYMTQSAHIDIVGNTFINCSRGVQATVGNANNVLLSSNYFINTSEYCVRVSRNAQGTGTPKEWLVTGNHFDNDAIGTDTQDFTCVGNTIAAGKEFNFGKLELTGATRYLSGNNRMYGGSVFF